jgi:hypothetical protein
MIEVHRHFTSLRLSGLPVGLLVNFNVLRLGIRCLWLPSSFSPHLLFPLPRSRIALAELVRGGRSIHLLEERRPVEKVPDS